MYAGIQSPSLGDCDPFLCLAFMCMALDPLLLLSLLLGRKRGQGPRETVIVGNETRLAKFSLGLKPYRVQRRTKMLMI